MSPRRPDLASQDGVAMYTVVLVMMVLLILGAALVAGGQQSSTKVNEDELAVRALQAAEAGAQTAVHRLNVLQPQGTQCITTVVSAPPSGSSWCDRTAAESVGNAQSFTYQVSSVTSGSCTGSSYGSTTSERCVVATGTAGAVSRRIIQRVVSATGQDPFPNDGILGKDSVTVDNNTIVAAGISSNGQLSMGNGTTVTGGVTLWNGAPNPIGYTGSITRQPTSFVLSPPNMLNPATLLDSKSSNDNGRLLAGANPADSCSGGNGQSGTCYTNTAASPRTLSLGNQGSVTLGGSTYNFCQLNLGQGAAVNIASNARALIYIDSPDRPGSGCVAGQGGITSGNNAIFSNPSGDPRALQIIVYGSTAFPAIQLPNNANLAAAVYAWDTAISFKNNGTFTGGLTAKSVTIKNNATWDNRLNGFTLATTLVYFRGAWRQCSSRTSAPVTAPQTGCL